MSLVSSDLPEERIVDLLDKQINRYHAIVGRFANNSVQVKTWCVTAVGAVSALAVNNERDSLFLVALAILGLFMLLDAYYLSLERRFRAGGQKLVADVASGSVGHIDRFFVPGPAGSAFSGVGGALRSVVVLPFYAVTAGLLLVGFLTT